MSVRKKVKVGASRRRRKRIGRDAEKFNRLNQTVHDLNLKSRGYQSPEWQRARALSAQADALWEKIQKDVRKRTKRRKSVFDSR